MNGEEVIIAGVITVMLLFVAVLAGAALYSRGKP
jgi:hypothetical protein